MNKSYFQNLQNTLGQHERHLPCIVIDLDILDQNIKHYLAKQPDSLGTRLVVKSIPVPGLLKYLSNQLNTQQYMVFHEPFLGKVLQQREQATDILLGKPMPVKSVAHFYKNHSVNQHRIQWLIDTEERLQQYLQLSRSMNVSLEVNLEVDVGLHRGGFSSLNSIKRILTIIKNVPDQMSFRGLMGYDPHVVKLPKWLSSPNKAYQKSQERYAAILKMIKQEFPAFWKEDLCINGGGSPSVPLHQSQTVANEISVGSLFLKPSDFDLPGLAIYQACCFIAAPILKKRTGTKLPGLERFHKSLARLKPNWRHSYFIYGGHWLADACFPADAVSNPLFGPSSNQSLINSKDGSFEVDDYLFLRPRQSEAVLLQFEEVIGVRQDKIEVVWRTF
ncbi:MAG: alanine racemase [Bacteroidota bacterium]